MKVLFTLSCLFAVGVLIMLDAYLLTGLIWFLFYMREMQPLYELLLDSTLEEESDEVTEERANAFLKDRKMSKFLFIVFSPFWVIATMIMVLMKGAKK